MKLSSWLLHSIVIDICKSEEHAEHYSSPPGQVSFTPTSQAASPPGTLSFTSVVHSRPINKDAGLLMIVLDSHLHTRKVGTGGLTLQD